MNSVLQSLTLKYAMDTFFTESYSCEHSPKIRVMCGLEFLRETIEDSLRVRNLASLLHHPIDIVFDADWRFAGTVPLDPKRASIFITDNGCPQYWTILAKRKPTVLLAGKNFDVAEVLELALEAEKLFSRGRYVNYTPDYEEKLTDAELGIFWWAIQREGYSNEEIAKFSFNSLQTVNNHLSTIYKKLGIRSGRLHLNLYFQEGPEQKDVLQSGKQLLHESVVNYRANQ